MNTFLTPEEQIYALQLQLSHFLEKLHETEKMMAQVSLFHQKKCKRLFHQSADTSVDLIYDQTGQLKSLLDQLQQAYQAKYFLQVEGLIRTFGFECLNFTRMQSGLANFYDRFPE
ncbi:MAG TPA: hypothetical protein DHN33_07770, partial [Eubacteriaceae bacterium]|nr:hypothetical protein [Eubacteriaceae bacterium]